VTGSDVPDDDMLNSLWPSRTDVPPTGDAALDALLTPDQRPEDTTGALRPVAEVLAALRAAPSGGELTGLDGALAAFRSGTDLTSPQPHPLPGPQPQPLPGPQPRPSPVGQAWRRTMLRLRVAVAVAVAAFAAFGAAAYAGVLPAALQKFAHDTIAAPQAKASHPHGAGAGAGSHPTSAATYGLCNAYQHAMAHGNGRQKSAAFHNLAAAAGGPGKVAAFCASVTKPGAAPGAPGVHGAPGAPGAPGASHTPPGKAVGQTGQTPPGKAVHTPPGQSHNGGGSSGSGNNGGGSSGGGSSGGGPNGSSSGGGSSGSSGGGQGGTGSNGGGGHGNGGAKPEPAHPGKAQ
jgi:uncharacterized membrane protein YgcG